MSQAVIHPSVHLTYSVESSSIMPGTQEGLNEW